MSKFLSITILFLFVLSSFAQNDRAGRKSTFNSNPVANNNKKIIAQYIDIAQNSEDRGSHSGAKNFYKRALDLDETNIIALEGYVRASVNMGQFVDTERYLSELASKYPLDEHSVLNPEDEKTLYPLFIVSEYAYLFLSTGRLFQAEKYMEKIETAYIEDEYKNKLIANIFFKAGRVEYAKEYLINARKKSETPNSYSLELSQIYLSEMNFKMATDEILNYILLDENNFDNAEAMLFNMFDVASEDEQELIIETLKYRAESEETFKKLLSSAYFRMEKYDLSYGWLLKTESDKDSLSLKFAEKLYSEKDYYSAPQYYEIFLDRYKELSDSFYVNYISSLVESKKQDKALNLLISRNLTPLLEIELAKLYLYNFNNLEDAKVILDRLSNNRSNVNSKIRFYSNTELAKIEFATGDMKTARKMFGQLKSNREYHRNIDLKKEVEYLGVLTHLYTDKIEEFKPKVMSYIKRNRPKLEDNNLLTVLRDVEVASKDNELLELYLKHLKFETVPVIELDFDDNKSGGLYDYIKYRYFKLTNNNEMLESVINKLLSNKSENKYKTKIIYDYALYNDTRQEELLKYILNNGADDFYKEKARTTLREITNNRIN